MGDVDQYAGKPGQLRPQQGSSAVRVVLAETTSPGSLHYLLEAEGFQVLGCASNERDLIRMLTQDVDPDVIVFDSDISVTSVSVVNEYAPGVLVIVIWPDGVQPPAGARRVAPCLVYEELGPAIRSAVSAPVVVQTSPAGTVAASSEPAEDLAPPAGERSPRLVRTAARTSAMSIVLIAAIVMTMGAVFAVSGIRIKEREASKRSVAQTSDTSTPAPTGSTVDRPATRATKGRACQQARHRSPNRQASDVARDVDPKPCSPRAVGTSKSGHAHGGRHNAGKPRDAGQRGGGHGHSAIPHANRGSAHSHTDVTHAPTSDSRGQSGQHGHTRPSSGASPAAGANSGHDAGP
jgi:hypothetical protein